MKESRSIGPRKASFRPSSRPSKIFIFSPKRTDHENAVIGMLIKSLLSTLEGDLGTFE